ncbi:hypothetical protein Bbelb_162480 [Branchiostoma belcheri]|nr:hypothetical protein Bbelb_162480 [Branchiostoma belcheri]
MTGNLGSRFRSSPSPKPLWCSHGNHSAKQMLGAARSLRFLIVPKLSSDSDVMTGLTHTTFPPNYRPTNNNGACLGASCRNQMPIAPEIPEGFRLHPMSGHSRADGGHLVAVGVVRAKNPPKVRGQTAGGAVCRRSDPADDLANNSRSSVSFSDPRFRRSADTISCGREESMSGRPSSRLFLFFYRTLWDYFRSTSAESGGKEGVLSAEPAVFAPMVPHQTNRGEVSGFGGFLAGMRRGVRRRSVARGPTRSDDHGHGTS